MTLSLRDIGVMLVRRAPGLERFARWAYGKLPPALHETPTTLLKDLFEGAPSVTFIQIGAFDGVAGDPIRELVLGDGRWRGVLVEPQPAVFQRLRNNYASASGRLQFMQCAVSSESSARPFYFIPQHEIDRLGLEAWAGEVASFDRNHVQKHFPTALVNSLDVQISTVTELARQADLGRIDLVVMDVEGHERTIIESIDWQGMGIRACVFEHKHMNPREIGDLERLFERNGFTFKRFGRDMVAFKTPSLADL